MAGSGWLLYEGARHLVVSGFKRRQEARVDRFLRDRRIPEDPFRYTHRRAVRQLVLSEPGLVQAMVEQATGAGESYDDVEARVRVWLEEIVPQFSPLAYYRVGYRLGRRIAYALYNVRLDQESLSRAQASIPEGASVVYVSNHRSNADFVVTGFMLSRSVQVSYAVGEWARVWPLEGLFRSFGSYFVRRGETDPLYHKTLQTYVELITKQSVTQAMFPEGGLSRDGRLRPVKLGLLDSMALAKLDPAFDKPLVFVPVGINFDRVIEDENMVFEATHGRPRRARRSFGVKLLRLGSLLVRGPMIGALNLGRLLSGRLKKHGVAAIHFGEPISFDEWYAKQAPFLHDADRKVRQEALLPFGQIVMEAIARTVPATPVTAVCAAAVRVGQARMEEGVDEGTLLLALRDVLEEIRRDGRPVATGDPYLPNGGMDADAIADEVDAADERTKVLDRALDVLERRDALVRDKARRVRADRWDLVVYYANSLADAAVGLQAVEQISAQPA